MYEAGALLGGGRCGWVVGSCGIVLCVLYPSGTDLRTLIPTLMRSDCTWSGIGGDSVERTGCDLGFSFSWLLLVRSK